MSNEKYIENALRSFHSFLLAVLGFQLYQQYSFYYVGVNGRQVVTIYIDTIFRVFNYFNYCILSIGKRLGMKYTFSREKRSIFQSLIILLVIFESFFISLIHSMT
jgi:hypothetical protein